MTRAERTALARWAAVGALAFCVAGWLIARIVPEGGWLGMVLLAWGIGGLAAALGIQLGAVFATDPPSRGGG